jgi:hypothetical protein
MQHLVFRRVHFEGGPEVTNFYHAAVVVHEDIVELDVSVDDLETFEVPQCDQQLLAVHPDGCDVDPDALPELFQSLPEVHVEVFEYQRGVVLPFARWRGVASSAKQQYR